MQNRFSPQPIEQRLTGSFSARFWRELFRNTGQFPIGILLIEVLTEGSAYLGKPDMYVLIPSTLVQAYWLAKQAESRGWRRLLGNLIAPALYTFGEVAIEGFVFFQSPHHVAYWGFAVVIGLLQALQTEKDNFFADAMLVLENVVRAQILFAAYMIFENYTNPSQTTSLTEFFSDPSHILIGLITLLLGLAVGLADVNASRSLTVLQQTAGRLKVYSEWLLGRDLLGRAIDDPNAMRLTRQRRTVLFMDIRNFTRWSEEHTPEELAALMNDYYLSAESVLNAYQVIKYKFTADEVMAVFLDSNEAVQAAVKMRTAAQSVLGPAGLAVGIGIHVGTLAEGLLGGQHVRFYDVLGDTVNTAERIESAAGANEIWISEAMRASISEVTITNQKEITVKGKKTPVKVYSIQ